MRSELAFGARAHMSNGYQLCQLVFKATRKLHRPETRLQDTVNDVLECISHSIPIADTQVVLESARSERRAA